MSSKVSEIAEGATKGSISWGEKKIKELVIKFRNRKIVFIQDNKTIELVKAQLRSGEWSLCSQYLKNRELKLLVQMGLALRRLDEDQDIVALQNLRTRILDKYGKKGLHIAQFVQCKILTTFIGRIAEKAISVNDLSEKLENFLNNLEKNLLFVQKKDDYKKKVSEVIYRLKANVPEFFILFTSKSAIKIGLNIKRYLEKRLEGYDIDTIQEKNRLLLFFIREDVDFMVE